jgi:hypothetical protein
MIRPLTKRKQDDGQLYVRPDSVQKWLERLDGLAMPDRTDQLETGITPTGEEIPLEVLVYFARIAWRENDKATFKRIYLALYSRVEALTLSAIPDSRFPDAASAREATLAKFVDLISEDCKGLHDRLDYFEVRFNSGLCGMRISVVRKIHAAAKKSINAMPFLRKNAETGEDEISPEIEEEALRIATQNFSRLDDPAFRSSLFAAIDKLPRELREVLHLRLKGMPIDAADSNTMTISRTLKCTDRTVRNRYARGVLALQELLKEKTDE